MPAARRRTTVLLPGVVAVVLGLLALLPGSGASADTATQQRDVKRQRAEVASQIDTLQATDAELDSALADLHANVRATQAAMADAQAEVDSAQERADQAERDAAATQRRIEALRDQVVEAAVDAYVDPREEEVLDAFQESSANDASNKQALIDVTSGAKLDVVDEYRSAKQDLEDQRAEAEKARAEASERLDALSQKKAGYDTALAQQQQVAASVSARISDKLAESQALASLDASLASQLAKEQEALVARLRESNVGGSASGGSSGGGGSTTPVITRPGLSTVRGITVASSVAPRLAALLDAAQAAGITLGGSGYRDSSGQIALRRQNCGTSDYAIYQMNPDACRPPTAIPGRSNHERGLAVDFTVNGRAIQSRSDPAFQWLAANAGSYGFSNLPSEPWHWSTDGT
jgi:hypothetical protein